MYCLFISVPLEFSPDCQRPPGSEQSQDLEHVSPPVDGNDGDGVDDDDEHLPGGWHTQPQDHDLWQLSSLLGSSLPVPFLEEF